MTSEEERKENYNQENFRLFYQIEYERIDKLETRRENFCNYIISISSAIFAILITSLNDTISIENKNILILFIGLLNILVIIFIDKTRIWIQMHQSRAEMASLKYALEFIKIKDDVGKAESDTDLFRRSRIYSYVHLLIIIASIFIFLSENKIIFK